MGLPLWVYPVCFQAQLFHWWSLLHGFLQTNTVKYNKKKKKKGNINK